MLDTGYWMLDTGYWILDAGYWILDAGCWMFKRTYNLLFVTQMKICNYMSDKKLDKEGAENPEKLTGVKLGNVKKSAGGIPAVISSIRHVVGGAGLVRGWKALKKLNQKDGFTCPSCAWPDPDDDRRRFAEYCENGAKAVAEEATTKKLCGFFSKTCVRFSRLAIDGKRAALHNQCICRKRHN